VNAQRGAALAFLALSIAYLALALPIEEMASGSAGALGPRAFPLFVGGLGVVISILLLLAPVAGGVTAAPPGRGVFAGDWRRVLALCGLTLLYAAALPILGFTLATGGFLSASFRLLGERRRSALIVVPLAIALVSLALLRGALGAHLPEPLFERWW
jgi:putative tricarboxylic transport membrane protein